MARYVCAGTCGGSVSEDEYEGGKKTCGMEGCTMYGRLLRRLDFFETIL